MGKIKLLISFLLGLAAAYFRQYALLYVLVTVAALLDLATGVSASVIEGTGLSSKIARRGFLKKFVLLIGVGFGTFLDVLLPMCAGNIGIHLPQNLLFSTVICVYICLSECISITENIYRCVGGAMPSWIAGILREAKDNLEHK